MFVSVTHHGGEPFTFRGALVVHDSREELEWLVPTHPVREIPGRTPGEVAARLGVPVLALKDHPDMASVRWPLKKEDFR
jgi:hypothetical protein